MCLFCRVEAWLEGAEEGADEGDGGNEGQGANEDERKGRKAWLTGNRMSKMGRN